MTWQINLSGHQEGPYVGDSNAVLEQEILVIARGLVAALRAIDKNQVSVAIITGNTINQIDLLV